MLYLVEPPKTTNANRGSIHNALKHRGKYFTQLFFPPEGVRKYMLWGWNPNPLPNTVINSKTDPSSAWCRLNHFKQYCRVTTSHPGVVRGYIENSSLNGRNPNPFGISSGIWGLRISGNCRYNFHSDTLRLVIACPYPLLLVVIKNQYWPTGTLTHLRVLSGVQESRMWRR